MADSHKRKYIYESDSSFIPNKSQRLSSSSQQNPLHSLSNPSQNPYNFQPTALQIQAHAIASARAAQAQGNHRHSDFNFVPSIPNNHHPQAGNNRQWFPSSSQPVARPPPVQDHVYQNLRPVQQNLQHQHQHHPQFQSQSQPPPRLPQSQFQFQFQPPPQSNPYIYSSQPQQPHSQPQHQRQLNPSFSFGPTHNLTSISNQPSSSNLSRQPSIPTLPTTSFDFRKGHDDSSTRGASGATRTIPQVDNNYAHLDAGNNVQQGIRPQSTASFHQTLSGPSWSQPLSQPQGQSYVQGLGHGQIVNRGGEATGGRGGERQMKQAANNKREEKKEKEEHHRPNPLPTPPFVPSSSPVFLPPNPSQPQFQSQPEPQSTLVPSPIIRDPVKHQPPLVDRQTGRSSLSSGSSIKAGAGGETSYRQLPNGNDVGGIASLNDTQRHLSSLSFSSPSKTKKESIPQEWWKVSSFNEQNQQQSSSTASNSNSNPASASLSKPSSSSYFPPQQNHPPPRPFATTNETKPIIYSSPTPSTSASLPSTPAPIHHSTLFITLSHSYHLSALSLVPSLSLPPVPIPYTYSSSSSNRTPEAIQKAWKDYKVGLEKYETLMWAAEVMARKAVEMVGGAGTTMGNSSNITGYSPSKKKLHSSSPFAVDETKDNRMAVVGSSGISKDKLHLESRLRLAEVLILAERGKRSNLVSGGGRMESQQQLEEDLVGGCGGNGLDGKDKGKERDNDRVDEQWVWTGEADKVVSKGLSLAASHPNLAIYRWKFETLQIELAAKKGNLRFARKRCKECLKELNTSTNLPSYSILYQFHFLQITLLADGTQQPKGPDFPASWATLREVEKLANHRGDIQMVFASRIWMVRLALCMCRVEAAGEVLKKLEDELSPVAGRSQKTTGDPTQTRPQSGSNNSSSGSQDATPVKVNFPLRLQLSFLSCIYNAEAGDIKKAKERLKEVHKLLDDETSWNENKEWANGLLRIPVKRPERRSSSPGTGRSPSPGKSDGESQDSVDLLTLPRGQLYALAFLVSAVVHRDAFGAKPQAKLYVVEGSKTIHAGLKGTLKAGSIISPYFSTGTIRTTLKEFATMKIRLSLLGVELWVMRSDFKAARDLLDDTIAFATSFDLFDDFSIRITLCEGMLAHGLCRFTRALQCYETVRWLCSRDKTGLLEIAHLETLAEASTLVVKIGQGAVVRTTETTDMVRRKGQGSDASDGEDLDALASEIVAKGKDGVAAMRLLSSFVEALTSGEIVKAKQHLGEALSLSGTVVNNHMRALILSLLACLYLHTNEDAANKMLVSAYFLCRSMGSTRSPMSDIMATTGTPDKESVGAARCGLWLGERLLDWYRQTGEKDKAARQEAYNHAHCLVLDSYKSLNV